MTSLLVSALALSFAVQNGAAYVAPEKSFDSDFVLNQPQKVGPGGGLKVLMGDSDLPKSSGGGVNLVPGNWPELNGLGISTGTFRINECGATAPHIHADATEFQTAVSGECVIATVDVFDAKLSLEYVSVGDTFFFPKGAIHFQVNVGTEPFVSIGAFDVTQPTAAGVLPFIAQLGNVSTALGLDTDMMASTDGLETPFPQFQVSKCEEVVAMFKDMAANPAGRRRPL